MSVWVEAATAIGTVVTALGGAAGLRALVRRRPRLTRTDAAVALSEGTIRWAERLEAASERALQRAEAAEQKADKADARADAAERRAMQIDAQLGQVVGYLDMLLRAMNDPSMTLPRLRELAANRPPMLAHRGD